MIASLPMYDWDNLRPATDRLWALIRDRLREGGLAAPDKLSRSADPWADWQRPDLVLSQTCGFPFRATLHDKVALVGTPDFGLDGVPAGYYFSQLVVGKDAPGDWTAFLGGRLAINGTDSQSGWAAPQNHAALIGQRFKTVIITGAHRESARAVAEGRADIAAIDAVTWRLIEAHLPDIAQKLRVVARTQATPGLPLITAKGNDAAIIAAAVTHAISRLPQADKLVLGLRGLCQIEARAYLAIPTPAVVQDLTQSA
jgi:ABC-type phosphate/phosphonate transport system substrate-binding protein